jgi:hypothetical protein
MLTPFDEVLAQIKRRGFHNQRLEDHSDILSDGILNDLKKRCEVFAADFAGAKIQSWKNVRTPGARNRKIDLLAGESNAAGEADLEKLRFCIENKSVITAHRNRYASFDDLNEALQVLHRAKSEAVLVATVIVGVPNKVLNVPDKVRPLYRKRPGEFKDRIVPRLSSGDQSLLDEFESALSLESSRRPGKDR